MDLLLLLIFYLVLWSGVLNDIDTALKRYAIRFLYWLFKSL